MSGDVYWILISIHNILVQFSCFPLTLLWSRQKVLLHFRWHTQNSLPNSIKLLHGIFFVSLLLPFVIVSLSESRHMFLKVVQNLHFFNLPRKKKRKKNIYSICMIISVESFHFAFILYSEIVKEWITNLIKLKIKKFIVEWQQNAAATNAPFELKFTE